MYFIYVRVIWEITKNKILNWTERKPQIKKQFCRFNNYDQDEINVLCKNTWIGYSLQNFWQFSSCFYPSTRHQLKGNQGRSTLKVAIHANPQIVTCSPLHCITVSTICNNIAIYVLKGHCIKMVQLNSQRHHLLSIKSVLECWAWPGMEWLSLLHFILDITE